VNLGDLAGELRRIAAELEEFPKPPKEEDEAQQPEKPEKPELKPYKRIPQR